MNFVSNFSHGDEMMEPLREKRSLHATKRQKSTKKPLHKIFEQILSPPVILSAHTTTIKLTYDLLMTRFFNTQSSSVSDCCETLLCHTRSPQLGITTNSGSASKEIPAELPALVIAGYSPVTISRGAQTLKNSESGLE